jgi:hypothetical protein
MTQSSSRIPQKGPDVIGHEVPPNPAAPTALTGVSRLFHQLNNQLGIILANAELLENRLADESHRLRAGQVVASALDAIETARKLRLTAEGAPLA